jgi:hypothetical protein
MESERLLPYSQDSVTSTASYPEPDESSSNHPILFLWIPLSPNLYLGLPMASIPQVILPKLSMQLSYHQCVLHVPPI